MDMNRPQSGFPPEIMEAASAWAMRADDPDFSDWDGFTDWLSASPDHLPAYEAVLAQVGHAADLLCSAPAAESLPAQNQPDQNQRAENLLNDNLPDNVVELPTNRRRRWWPAGAAIAASLAIMVGFGVMGPGGIGWGGGPEMIATAAGEQRVVELADGSRIIMNGATSLTIDHDNPRHVELARGEALFEIRHDEANPFVVIAQGTPLLDAGTVFNVVADNGRLDVVVAEGAVIYRPEQDALQLNPGDGLSRASATAQPVLRKASPQGVGAWQNGQLHYDNAPLDQVAGDLARNLGRPVAIRGTAANARFTGTLALKGSSDQVLDQIGPLLGVSFTASGEGWIMSPTHDPPR